MKFSRSAKAKAKTKSNAKLRKPEEKTGFVSWRFALLCTGIGIALAALLIRVAYLQIINPDPLIREGDMRSLRVQKVPTARGMISDRMGRPLAVSVPVYAIWADPKVVLDANPDMTDSRWLALADALKISVSQIEQKIAAPSARFIYLARQVNPEISDYISKLKITGINMRQESKRYYPSGEVTAHIIGVTNIDGDGIEGVEKVLTNG